MKGKLYEVWIDGRIWGTVRAENADEASQQARELFKEQYLKSKEIRIEEQ